MHYITFFGTAWRSNPRPFDSKSNTLHIDDLWLMFVQASNGTMCVDLSGSDNNGLVTGQLCFASDIKVC